MESPESASTSASIPASIAGLSSSSASLHPDWISTGLIEATPEWTGIHANRAAAELLGVPGRTLEGARLAQFFETGESVIQRLNETRRARGVRLAREGRRTEADLFAEPTSRDTWLITLINAEARLAQEEELARLQKALAESERARSKMRDITTELTAAFEPPRIIGASAPMLRMLDQVERVAASPATVLIHGESGSGKELVARAIHAGSPRARRPLIAVNCASLPESLIESELFGHERGAFTGADRQRLGKFELADTGSLFLDEVAELSPAAQAKLLRVLQEGAFERVGGSDTVQVDVRLIAATHRNLATQVERGRFREDLFYRLNVFRIEVPPLRDRREDLRALAEFFHELHAKRMARPVLPISERSMRRLLTYRWPGNVRELENAVERATVLGEDSTELEIEIPDAPNVPRATDRGSERSMADGAKLTARDTSQIPRDVLLDLSLDQLQRLQIMHALETNRYRVFGKGAAAEKLGINPQTLLSRMDKLGIPRPRTMRRSLNQGDRADPA
jgi:transcriptional regulator with GAF, ATPase, and Fis domain